MQNIHHIVFVNQRGCLRDVMCICRSDRHGMNQPAASIHTDVAFHPEFPLITLFRLVHFRVALLLRVLVELGALMIVASTMVPPFIMCPVCTITRLIASKNRLHRVVSSGTASVMKSMPVNFRIKHPECRLICEINI